MMEILTPLKGGRGAHVSPEAQTINFSGSGGGVDKFDRGQAANVVSPRRQLRLRSAAGPASRVQPRRYLSQGAERQGQWMGGRGGGSRVGGGAWERQARDGGGARGGLRPESGSGGASEGGARPRGVCACARRSRRRGCARAVRGPWRAESRAGAGRGRGCGVSGVRRSLRPRRRCWLLRIRRRGRRRCDGQSPRLTCGPWACRSLGGPQPGRGGGGSVTSAR